MSVLSSLESSPPAGYFAHDRADLIAKLPRPVGRVLDIGCGAGGVARSLRLEPGDSITGIEIEPNQAALASRHYDQVIARGVPEGFEDLDGRFRTVLCLDVLEHLVDPGAVLRQISSELIDPDGTLQVSVPNARHLSLVRDLLLRGTFGYRRHGHRDVTHLRWFTRSDIVGLLESTGWTVVDDSGSKLKTGYRVLQRLSAGRATEFLAIQWHVLARPARPAPGPPG